jgi:hypothetical protein
VNPAPPKKESNPYTKVTLIALIPGAGQIYNKKYWKLPIVYGGFAALGYSYVFYRNEYNSVREAYIQVINKQTVTNPEYANVPAETLLNVRESYRKSRDLSIISMVGLYAIQIVDATVDAHLKGFDMSENLSLKISPDIKQTPYCTSAGLSFTLSIR